jgi:hypothetical protein
MPAKEGTQRSQQVPGQARHLNVRGRSNMTTQELAEAISRANDRATAAARNKQLLGRA